MVIREKEILLGGLIIAALFKCGFFLIFDFVYADQIIQMVMLVVLNIVSYYIMPRDCTGRIYTRYIFIYYLYIGVAILGVQYYRCVVLGEISSDMFISIVSPYLYLFYILPVFCLFYVTGGEYEFLEKIR